jgi:hypothetical protein
MAQGNSKLPKGNNLSKEMIGYLQMIESRIPSQTDALATDGTVTLVELINRFNALVNDLNKR